MATLSGIEVTNIGLYLVVGRYYGYLGLSLIAILFIPMIYLQETISYLKTINREVVPRGVSSLLYYTFALIGSLFILLINSYVYASILHSLFHIPIFATLFFYLIIVFIISNNEAVNKRVLELFVYGSLFLTIYVVSAFFVVYTKGFPQELPSEYPSIYVLIALFGALSSPYSLIIQEDSNSLSDLLISYFYGVLVGLAIGILGFYDTGSDSVFDLFAGVEYNYVLMYLLLAGLTSTVILSSISIFTTLKRIVYKMGIRGRGGYRYEVYTILVSYILLVAYNFMNSDDILDLITDFSFITGVSVMVLVLLLILSTLKTRLIPIKQKLFNVIALTSTLLFMFSSILFNFL